MTGATKGRLDSKHPGLVIQAERARPQLANARQKFCDSPSQFCNELTCLLASSRCSAIVRTTATLLTGLAAKESRGRTPRGRAQLAQQRNAPRRAGMTRRPRPLEVQHHVQHLRGARLNSVDSV